MVAGNFDGYGTPVSSQDTPEVSTADSRTVDASYAEVAFFADNLLLEASSKKEYKAHNGYVPLQKQAFASNECALDLSEVVFSEPGQKCFGNKTEVEKVLDSRCLCLQSKCLHLSGTLILLCSAGLVLIYVFRHYLKDMLEWLEDLDGWVSGLLFVLMFTVVSFPMTWGYIVLNVACGYLYGLCMGLLTVAVSVSVGVAVSLVVCRKFMKDFVQSKLQSEHLKAIIRVVESRRGFKVVVLTRLTPIPFGLQNGLFAITNMNLSKCLLASFFGLLPTQTLNTYIGSSLRTMEDVLQHHSLGDYVLLAVQVGMSAFLMWYVIRRARYELNKACLPPSTYEQLEAKVGRPSSVAPLIRVHSGLPNNIASHSSPVGSDVSIVGEIPTTTAKRKSEQGHKRAHSASAVLYASQNPPEET